MEEKKVMCPACGAEMDQKLRSLSIGADGGGGLFAALVYEQYSVDLYACPQCGKVELYTAGFQKEEEKPEEVPEQVLEDKEQPAPQSGGFLGFGKRKEKRPPWEK